jgi:putative membrane protein
LTPTPLSGSIQRVKSILRKIIFYSVALFLTAQIFEGVKVNGGMLTYILGGVVLSLLFLIIKPILSIVTLPLNIITLGLFSFITNAIILYLLTIFVANISIAAFSFRGLSFLGFVIPGFSVNNFFAFIIVSVLVSFIVGFLKWLIEK